jgi:L-alanine-DL-glutamate epimerase-like enolase superfamily enzyme
VIGDHRPFRVRSVRAAPLSVPLREPFVIATARMDATRAALVTAEVERDGSIAVGYGEAAALPPVTREDQPELVERIGRVSLGDAVDIATLETALDRECAGSPVARAGVETAVLDALARLSGVTLASLIGGGAPHGRALTTDITLPIARPDAMAAGARAWRARGFSCFKVKVGRAWRDDRDALRAVQAAVEDARFRLDANEGFDARDALALLDDALGAGLTIECFEQPVPRADLAGLAEVGARSGVPVIADESLRTESDLDAILSARAAQGINLKLVKHGGPLAALALGARAKREGLLVMTGAMVETRLGLTAMAHVALALGGVDFVDLDTAHLLARDPFAGGLAGEGPELAIDGAPGLGIRILDVYGN